MRTTVERLRFWILAIAGLLVAGILLFFGYARWQARHIAHDLPGKLGISIQQSTEGFTFSKSERGHTLFTLHAAKTVQYKGGGHADLHDVSITLYDAGGAPADRIYGNDFDYDPADGVVRANGAVEIDLQGPAGSTPSNAPSEENENKNVVHVKTADLVFNQKTGMASTTKPIEFRIAEAAGNATGASFDSRKGVLVLDRDVSFDSSLEGTPLTVRARHAQFDRASRQLHLVQTVTGYQLSRSSSDQATVYFRPNGSAYRIEAQGHVTMANDNQKITSRSGLAELDTKSRPEQVFLDGGVLYTAKDASRSIRGTAGKGTLFFGPQAAIRHAQLRNTVSIADKESARNPQAGKRTAKSYQPVRLVNRDVEASQIDVDFSRAPNRRPEARRILAVGSARLNIHTLYVNTPPEETSVQGDRLLVTLRNGAALSNLRGTGHTKLLLINSNGVKQTSTGDNLLMTFAPAAENRITAAAKRNAQAQAPPQQAQLESAEQQGNVTLVQQTPVRQTPATNHPMDHPALASATPAAPVISTATAERATYEAATQLIRLSGNPRLRDANGELTASAIEFERLTGNANATGGVKVTYRQSAGQSPVSFGGAEPVHVVASRAHLDRAKGLSTFYGSAGETARLWQGADSISAPVIEISRMRRTLTAYGSGPAVQAGGADRVEAALTRAETAAGRKAVQPVKREQNSVVRVNSQTLLYSDAEAKAVFRGNVVARSSSGLMTSNQMDVYFAAGNGAGPSGVSNRGGQERKPEGSAMEKPANEPGKGVERIVAQGNVQLQEPGRKASGDQLVYTAQDGKFVLTGSRHSPPRLIDEVHGTVTGASLIFNDRDDSVMVSGGASRAVTETRVAK